MAKKNEKLITKQDTKDLARMQREDSKHEKSTRKARGTTKKGKTRRKK